MAEDSEKTGADASATPGANPGPLDAKSELPSVDSPSISPANDTAAEADKAPEPIPSRAIVPFAEPVADSPIAPEASARKPFHLRTRHKVMAALAASAVIAGAVGVMAGVVASGGFKATEAPTVDMAAVEERKTTQQSIAQLNKEIGALKASLQAANKAANTQIAKLTERLNREAAEITGSISAPQTTAPAVQAATPVATPLPMPRPTRMAMVERPSVVQDWSIRNTRNGYVYVQNRGEVYEVVPGAPLPGLGAVERIQRQDGRWVVVTPRGLIVSARDRAHFE